MLRYQQQIAIGFSSAGTVKEPWLQYLKQLQIAKHKPFCLGVIFLLVRFWWCLLQCAQATINALPAVLLAKFHRVWWLMKCAIRTATRSGTRSLNVRALAAGRSKVSASPHLAGSNAGCAFTFSCFVGPSSSQCRAFSGSARKRGFLTAEQKAREDERLKQLKPVVFAGERRFGEFAVKPVARLGSSNWKSFNPYSSKGCRQALADTRGFIAWLSCP